MSNINGYNNEKTFDEIKTDTISSIDGTAVIELNGNQIDISATSVLVNGQPIEGGLENPLTGDLDCNNNNLTNVDTITTDIINVQNQATITGTGEVLTPALTSAYESTQSSVITSTKGGKWTISVPIKIKAIGIPVGHWTVGSTTPREFNIWTEGVQGSPLHTYVVPKSNNVSGYYQYNLPTIITIPAGSYRHGVTFEPSQLYDENFNNMTFDSRFSNTRPVTTGTGGSYPQSVASSTQSCWYSGQLIIDDTNPSLSVTGIIQVEDINCENIVIDSSSGNATIINSSLPIVTRKNNLTAPTGVSLISTDVSNTISNTGTSSDVSFVSLLSTQAHTDVNRGTDYRIYTCLNNTSTPIERLNIASDGITKVTGGLDVGGSLETVLTGIELFSIKDNSLSSLFEIGGTNIVSHIPHIFYSGIRPIVDGLTSVGSSSYRFLTGFFDNIDTSVISNSRAGNIRFDNNINMDGGNVFNLGGGNVNLYDFITQNNTDVTALEYKTEKVTRPASNITAVGDILSVADLNISGLVNSYYTPTGGKYSLITPNTVVLSSAATNVLLAGASDSAGSSRIQRVEWTLGSAYHVRMSGTFTTNATSRTLDIVGYLIAGGISNVLVGSGAVSVPQGTFAWELEADIICNGVSGINGESSGRALLESYMAFNYISTPSAIGSEPTWNGIVSTDSEEITTEFSKVLELSFKWNTSSNGTGITCNMATVTKMF
jgi:hypothetical protein